MNVYLRHLRPLSFPAIAVHILSGSMCAWCAAPDVRFPAFSVACGTLLWSVLLNGGTFALNSAFDEDREPVILLDPLPPVPKHLHVFGLGLMLAGLVPAFVLSIAFGCLYSGCLFMSCLYSMPPSRLKARAGWDLVVYVAGYGIATFYAGATLIEWHVGRYVHAMAVVMALAMLCLAPPLQIRDEIEDARRQYRTFSLVVGTSTALAVSVAAALLACMCVTLWAWQWRAPWVAVLLLPLGALGWRTEIWRRHIATTDAKREPVLLYALMPAIDVGAVLAVAAASQ